MLIGTILWFVFAGISTCAEESSEEWKIGVIVYDPENPERKVCVHGRPGFCSYGKCNHWRCRREFCRQWKRPSVSGILEGIDQKRVSEALWIYNRNL